MVIVQVGGVCVRLDLFYLRILLKYGDANITKA